MGESKPRILMFSSCHCTIKFKYISPKTPLLFLYTLNNDLYAAFRSSDLLLLTSDINFSLFRIFFLFILLFVFISRINSKLFVIRSYILTNAFGPVTSSILTIFSSFSDKVYFPKTLLCIRKCL